MKTKLKIGIDEAGRWPWAGPVVACALAFNPNNIPEVSFLQELNDSKKLSPKKRESLYERLVELSSPDAQIWKPHQTEPYPNPHQTEPYPNPLLQGEGTSKNEAALFFGLGVVDNFFIDQFGIKQANREAMRRALIEIQRKIPKKYEIYSVLSDGNDNYVFDELEQKPLYIVWGDAKVMEISAASIIAKVFRDKIMAQYATLYPEFHFETNAGYWVKRQSELLEKKENITWIHRLSYKPVKESITRKEKVLVHICCGPDATIPLMDMKQEYDIIAYWYDPNIHPQKEYEKRFEAFVKVCEIEKVPYIKGEYDAKNFFSRIKGMENTPERGEKCTHCYDMRLERTAKLAREMGITKWTSSLNNSPHKDLEKMCMLWEKWDNAPYSDLTPNLSQEEREQAAKALWEKNEAYMQRVKRLEENEEKNQNCENEWKQKLEFLKLAFRKNGGFERSVEYTKKHGIYRQNYCGCVYSDTFPGNPKNKGKNYSFNG